jgi:hypothetical protein
MVSEVDERGANGRFAALDVALEQLPPAARLDDELGAARIVGVDL